MFCKNDMLISIRYASALTPAQSGQDNDASHQQGIYIFRAVRPSLNPFRSTIESIRVLLKTADRDVLPGQAEVSTKPPPDPPPNLQARRGHGRIHVGRHFRASRPGKARL